ncbi:ArsA-related P-loop ATPase [Nocardioides yefusunii]|uniref:ArsA-related P-loop ATPase n=1 Tax=Nocardioides yefusunii TaxID=2500546 RepID=A0ABW1QYY2_9ACTN|nr:ArsA-related P-loop ATPase [Nocardioides yefusunii]
MSADLHIVTGKGGTGKSTVAAALALALASSGRRVLLCEVEGRQGIARMFDVDPLPYAETRLATGLPGDDGVGGSVNALHVDAESALLEYFAMYYRLGKAGKALEKFGVLEFATTIAPGVRDVLLTGKVYEAVIRNARNKGAITYDAVVMDAPPTGRITQFLNVNGELAGLAKVGPIRSQADKVMELFRSDATRVHLVTLLEEMPVQETIDGIAELRAVGLPVGALIANRVGASALSPTDLERTRRGELDPIRLAAELDDVGLAAPGAVEALVALAGEHAARIGLQDSQRELLTETGLPYAELPLLGATDRPDAGAAVDLAGLYELAGHLVATGVSEVKGSLDATGGQA